MQRGEVDVFFVAMSRFKRKKFEESIELCNELLERNPRDQVEIYSIYLGCLAAKMQSFS